MFSRRTTRPVAPKSIAKVPNQKVARRPKCFSFFFFRRASSNLHDSFTGFRTKQQHFSLSSAPAHRFFPCSKLHEAIRTTHWGTMASFTMPFFSSRVRMCTNHLATKCNYYAIRNTVGVRGVFGYVGWSCVLNCLMLSSLPCFYALCWSAIPASCYIFNVFYSCLCHFF